MELTHFPLILNNITQLTKIIEELLHDDNDYEQTEMLLLQQQEVLLKRFVYLRKRRNAVLAIAASLNNSKKFRVCRLWSKHRSKTFWEIECLLGNDAFFKENFRMTRESFKKLCETLKSLEKSDTFMRKAIPLHKRIAIALYALGSAAEYFAISNLFGVGKSTVCNILLDFCKQAWKVLGQRHMDNFSLTKEQIENHVKAFEALGIPQCMGAVAKCYVRVSLFSDKEANYYNYNGMYFTNLLALVDAQCKFINVNVGSEMQNGDFNIFDCSALKAQLDNCSLLNEMSRNISNVSVPIFILGDSSFRLTKNLMTPYPAQIDQNQTEKHFNYMLSRCTQVAENAFQNLKARFRRIGYGIENKAENVPLIVKTCCALHNFLKDNNDPIETEWLDEHLKVDQEPQYPEENMFLDDDLHAIQIREAISIYLMEFI